MGFQLLEAPVAIITDSPDYVRYRTDIPGNNANNIDFKDASTLLVWPLCKHLHIQNRANLTDCYGQVCIQPLHTGLKPTTTTGIEA